MIEIDLIPGDYRLFLFRQWLLKLSLGIAGAMVLLSISANISLSYFSQQASAEVKSLQKTQAITIQQRNQLDELKYDREEHRQQWKLLQGLRGNSAAASMLETIDQALLGRDVWFHNLEFSRSGIVIENKPELVNTGYFILMPQDSKNNQNKVWQVKTRMKITGQARDHSALSIFITQLYNQPLIKNVQIMKTSIKKINTVNIVNFDLNIIVNSHGEA